MVASPRAATRAWLPRGSACRCAPTAPSRSPSPRARARGSQRRSERPRAAPTAARRGGSSPRWRSPPSRARSYCAAARSSGGTGAVVPLGQRPRAERPAHAPVRRHGDVAAVAEQVDGARRRERRPLLERGGRHREARRRRRCPQLDGALPDLREALREEVLEAQRAARGGRRGDPHAARGRLEAELDAAQRPGARLRAIAAVYDDLAGLVVDAEALAAREREAARADERRAAAVERAARLVERPRREDVDPALAAAVLERDHAEVVAHVLHADRAD